VAENYSYHRALWRIPLRFREIPPENEVDDVRRVARDFRYIRAQRMRIRVGQSRGKPLQVPSVATQNRPLVAT
jgi:hypothetical protein